jgi:hypothetical protein
MAKAAPRIPSLVLPGVDSGGVQFFQGTLGGSLHKGLLESPNSDLYASQQPYGAVNYLKNSGSTGIFLPNVGCACGGGMNADNHCVSGNIETLPFSTNTAFQQSYLHGLLNHRPFYPISSTETAMMIRASPLNATDVLPQRMHAGVQNE